jgi:hypothetical protein
MRDSGSLGGSQTIVVDITGVQRASRIVADAAETLQLLGRRIASRPFPEMPAGVASEVTAALADVSGMLAPIPTELTDVAQELKVRALWAEVADRLTSGYDLSAGQRTAFEAAYASGLLLRYGDPGQVELARAYAKSKPEAGGRGLLAVLHSAWGAERKGSTVVGVARFFPWMSLQQSWDAVAPGSPLAEESGLLFVEHFPTANNGFLGRGVASVLVRAPGRLGRLGGILSDASRATPYFRYGGITVSTVSTGIGVYDIYRDRNKGGAQLATDVTGTLFSASTTAFLVAPTPLTGALVLASGAAWGGAEAWKHHKAIDHAVGDGATWVWDHSTPGVLWHNQTQIGAAFDRGIDLGSSLVGCAADGVKSLAGDALHGASGVGDGVKKGWNDVAGMFG